MIENRAYVKLDKKYLLDAEATLRLLLGENTEIVVENGLLKVSSFDCEGFNMILKTFLKNQTSEMINCKVLIVPSFEQYFVKYIDYVRTGVETLFEVFLSNMEKEEVKKDSVMIVEKIGKKHLDTIEAFIDCNMNVIKTSEMLYLHRNSLNYRLNQFMIDTNYDVRDLNTILFLKFIISIAKI